MGDAEHTGRAARNRWQVSELAGGRCRVAYAAEVQVRGLFGWLARWRLLPRVGRTGRHLLDDLKHYVEHGTPSPRKQRRLGRGGVTGVRGDRRHPRPVVAVGTWPSTRRLRAALRANAVFGLVCGVALLAAGWWLAGPWGLGPAALPPLVGAGVAGLGVILARLKVQPGPDAAPLALRW